jgi:hypothetical protein
MWGSLISRIITTHPPPSEIEKSTLRALMGKRSSTSPLFLARFSLFSSQFQSWISLRPTVATHSERGSLSLTMRPVHPPPLEAQRSTISTLVSKLARVSTILSVVPAPFLPNFNPRYLPTQQSQKYKEGGWGHSSSRRGLYLPPLDFPKQHLSHRPTLTILTH